jgi:uncharacterized ParB-like nuclease family protein
VRPLLFLHTLPSGATDGVFSLFFFACPCSRLFPHSRFCLHSYEAHKRLQSETIPGRIINVPPSAIRMYLGAGCPF